MKTLDEHFTDWEANTFGYGYGTGETHVLSVLKAFLEAVPPEGTYDYETLERVVSRSVAWLLINILAHDDKIEYGSSPRFGWLTGTGKALKSFVEGRPTELLCELTYRGEKYIHCYPNHCNCDDGDCRPSNPFWRLTG